MKTLFLVVLSLLSASTFAAGERGLGLMLGNPTGINGKKWLSDTRAVDAGLGLSFGKHSDVSVHSDYLLHTKGALYFNDNNPLDLYYGIGGRMEFADTIELGLRVPVGLVHEVEAKSADVFGEVAPILDFIGAKGLELHVLFGGRYYF